MATRLVFQPQLVEFKGEELEAWKSGARSECRDSYCRGIGGGVGSAGFGEFVVGRHWEARGYDWVHHDFDIFGFNPHKTYDSQAVLERLLGDGLEPFQRLCAALKPFRGEHHGAFEQPDLFVFREDTGEVRFAECKRTDTRDKVNPRQALGLFLLTAVLRVPVDIFIVAEAGRMPRPLDVIEFTCDEGLAAAG